MKSYKLKTEKQLYIHQDKTCPLLYLCTVGNCEQDQMMKKCLTTFANYVPILHWSIPRFQIKERTRHYHNQVKQNTVKANSPSSSMLGSALYQLLYH